MVLSDWELRGKLVEIQRYTRNCKPSVHGHSATGRNSGKAAKTLIGKSGNLPSRRVLVGREEPYEQEIVFSNSGNCWA